MSLPTSLSTFRWAKRAAVDSELYFKFAAHERTHWWYRGRRAVIRAVLERQLLPGRERRVLDVGCGTGAMFELLAAFGSVEGLEASQLGVELAREQHPNVPVHRGALPDEIPRAHRFELISAFDVL